MATPNFQQMKDTLSIGKDNQNFCEHLQWILYQFLLTQMWSFVIAAMTFKELL